MEITDRLYNRAAIEIENAIALGCRTFYFGGYGDFDALCYRIVSERKRKQPQLGLSRIYCVSQERYLWKRVRYFQREDYDDVIYLTPSFDGWYRSIYFRNCAMIDASDFVLFYAQEREDSGAYKAYRYAKKQKNKCIVNLFEENTQK